MASAAVSAASTIDLTAQTTLPIRLGASILKPTESKKFTSVRYNHKPQLDGSKSVKCSIQPDAPLGEDSLQLDLREGNKEYSYYGKYIGADTGGRYVLLPRGSGKDREMVLERLYGSTAFNLARMPDGAKVWKQRDQYPHLPDEDSASEDVLEDGTTVDHDPPDPKNPFDYRNYLKKGEPQPKRVNTAAPRETASAPSSQQQPKAEPTTPQSKQPKRTDGPLLSKTKRKAPADTSKPNPKRVKAGPEPSPPKSAPAPTPAAAAAAVPAKSAVPSVRLDRKPSLKLPPFEDSGELVVDTETPVEEKPRSAMALALAGVFPNGGGPISLHSAASSPAGRAASPAPARPGHVEDEGEIEFGESSPEATQSLRKEMSYPAEEDEEEEEDEAADADVEDFELPSPAQTQRQRDLGGRAAEAVAVGDSKAIVDEEDDLDKQLALAMAEEDEGDAAASFVPAESDEESEEE